MSKQVDFKKHLKRGVVYRRNVLKKWSTSVDRHLKELVKNGEPQKVGAGLHYYPQEGELEKCPLRREVGQDFP